MFENIFDEFKNYHEELKSWALGTDTWSEYKKQYDLKVAALKELIHLFETAGEENFIKLAETAISLNTGGCSPADLFGMIKDEKNRKEIEKSYYLKIEEINKEFLVSVLSEIPIETTMKFLSDSVGTNNFSKELIESMKYSPDAPNKFRDAMKTGNWSRDNLSINAKDENKKADNWYDLKEYTVNEHIEEADALALNNNIPVAIKIYKINLDKTNANTILPKLILCYLADGDSVSAKVHLEKLDGNNPHFPFLARLTETTVNYDYAEYTNVVKKYNDEIAQNDAWFITLLLIIKNSTF